MSKLAFIEAKKALLVNFTGRSYHWGCYGTSIEIYHTLIEKNYYVEILGVNVTHGLSPTVENASDFDDNKFFNKFCIENPSIVTSLIETDTVVVNGEGTLHRISKGSLNLLYIIYICKKYFNKEVHLINFSCFPNGDTTMPTDATSIYPNILRYVDHISPRDQLSHQLLSNSGVNVTQSFDCLPRFLERYGKTNSHVPAKSILVSGGVKFEDHRYDMLEGFIHYFLKKNVAVKFLLGAHFSPAQEDIELQNRLKSNPMLSNLQVVHAQSMKEWIAEFQSASFLFSARFHHSIAALSIGTPFRFLSSNTPKISAALETINENVDDFFAPEGDLNSLIECAENCLFNAVSISSETRKKSMTKLANVNFTNL